MSRGKKWLIGVLAVFVGLPMLSMVLSRVGAGDGADATATEPVPVPHGVAVEAVADFVLVPGTTRLMDIFDHLDPAGIVYSGGFVGGFAGVNCRSDRWPDSQLLCNTVVFEDDSVLRFVLQRGSSTDRGSVVVSSPDSLLFQH